MTNANESEDEMITFIPIKIYRKTLPLKSKGVQSSLSVTCSTLFIYAKHNLEAT